MFLGLNQRGRIKASTLKHYSKFHALTHYGTNMPECEMIAIVSRAPMLRPRNIFAG